MLKIDSKFVMSTRNYSQFNFYFFYSQIFFLKQQKSKGHIESVENPPLILLLLKINKFVMHDKNIWTSVRTYPKTLKICELKFYYYYKTSFLVFKSLFPLEKRVLPYHAETHAGFCNIGCALKTIRFN